MAPTAPRWGDGNVRKNLGLRKAWSHPLHSGDEGGRGPGTIARVSVHLTLHPHVRCTLRACFPACEMAPWWQPGQQRRGLAGASCPGQMAVMGTQHRQVTERPASCHEGSKGWVWVQEGAEVPACGQLYLPAQSVKCCQDSRSPLGTRPETEVCSLDLVL